jgi:hypothetical protein
VRDEGGNILIYSANDREDRGNVGIIRSPVRASILPDRGNTLVSVSTPWVSAAAMASSPEHCRRMSRIGVTIQLRMVLRPAASARQYTSV